MLTGSLSCVGFVMILFFVYYSDSVLKRRTLSVSVTENSDNEVRRGANVPMSKVECPVDIVIPMARRGRQKPKRSRRVQPHDPSCDRAADVRRSECRGVDHVASRSDRRRGGSRMGHGNGSVILPRTGREESGERSSRDAERQRRPAKRELVKPPLPSEANHVGRSDKAHRAPGMCHDVREGTSGIDGSLAADAVDARGSQCALSVQTLTAEECDFDVDECNRLFNADWSKWVCTPDFVSEVGPEDKG